MKTLQNPMPETTAPVPTPATAAAPATAAPTPWIEITPATYRVVADALRRAIDTSEWFNGSITGTLIPEEDCVPWRLTLTAIVYRRTDLQPEGARRLICDVVPLWWEFSTAQTLNTFSFSELKPYLIDYD